MKLKASDNKRGLMQEHISSHFGLDCISKPLWRAEDCWCGTFPQFQSSVTGESRRGTVPRIQTLFLGKLGNEPEIGANQGKLSLDQEQEEIFWEHMRKLKWRLGPEPGTARVQADLTALWLVFFLQIPELQTWCLDWVCFLNYICVAAIIYMLI